MPHAWPPLLPPGAPGRAGLPLTWSRGCRKVQVTRDGRRQHGRFPHQGGLQPCTEIPAVQKRGKDRRPPWLSSTTWLLVLLLAGSVVFWFFSREPTAINLKYGELTQILQAKDPAVRFLNVRAGHAEIRGELRTDDLVSDGGAQPSRLTQTRTFRVVR